MKTTALLGLLGLALSAACGGSDDDGGGGTPPTGQVASAADDADGDDETPPDAPKTGQSDGTGSTERNAPKTGNRYTYVLHGSDADVDAWLLADDIVTERSDAGGLTYAVVLTQEAREVPSALVP